MESVANIGHKIKINNSYESEPSSGSSGSSLGEQNDHASDDENMNLPYLLKPTLYNNKHLPIEQQLNLKSKLSQNQQQHSGDLFPVNNPESLESSFHGFGDSPYGNVNKKLYGSQHDKLKLPEPKAESCTKPTSGKLVFPKFYDTIVEENSSNAVDLTLAHKIAQQKCEQEKRLDDLHTKITSSSCELSFNGKIKNFTENVEMQPTVDSEKPSTSQSCRQIEGLTPVLETSLNSSQQHDSSVIRKYTNERSPDLFADSDAEKDDDEDITIEEEEKNVTTNTSLNSVSQPLECAKVDASFADEQTLDCSVTQNESDVGLSLFRENCRRERELLKRIRCSLEGIRPPPSITMPQIDIITAVVNLKTDILSFLPSNPSQDAAQQNDDDAQRKVRSLFKPTHTLAETQAMGWRDILGVRQHGLSYNLNKAAEQNEYLSLTVIDRYIGAETATSYANSPSSAKKRNSRLKLLMQSPGNRLSHLAKRRAVFSSANLATNSLKFNNTIGPQIVIDKKKCRNKRKATPKRMTPASKKKNRKTPSSSARKRLYRCDLIKPGPSRETSKRALFQSPAKSQQQQQKSMPLKMQIKPEIANRVEKSKRALFSPDNQATSSSSTSQLETLLKRKRNNTEDQDVDELSIQSSKMLRANSDKLTPRALKIKSQSFCIGAGSSIPLPSVSVATMPTTNHRGLGICSNQPFGGSNSSLLNTKLQRAQSDITAMAQNSLTDNQRKKLLWAVSQALQDKKITAKHPNFKEYAKILARTVKRIFQEHYQNNATSNSETMLRLAKKYVFNVISGRNADEIYLQAKAQVEDFKRQSTSRLSGYICAEEYEQLKLSQQSLTQSQMLSQRSKLSDSMHNIFTTDNSVDSFGLSQFSQTSSSFLSANGHSQTSALERIICEESSLMQNSYSSSMSASKQQPILHNPSLQNSSSKSNLGGLALRENVDCEQRRSAQKNFTGKDQRNMSPYTGNASSGRKVQSQLVGELSGSGVKVKRQITFDS